MTMQPIPGFDRYLMTWMRRKKRGQGYTVLKTRKIDGLDLAFSCRDCLRRTMKLQLLSNRTKRCPKCGWKPDLLPRLRLIEDIMEGDKA